MANFPHLYPIGASFFITFRLADSLPQERVLLLKLEFENEVKKINNKPISNDQKASLINALKAKTFGRFDRQLDLAPFGSCRMNDQNVAQIIWNKIFQYNDLYYIVEAFSIMPNHIHLLVDTSIQLKDNSKTNKDHFSYVNVSKWMQLIKGGSSFLINKHLQRKGILWKKESYDHFIKPDSTYEYGKIRDYILNNPIKAGLAEKFTKAPYMYSRL